MVDHTWIGGVAPRVFKMKAVAALDQAAPVQNTWYTVLDTTLNVKILGTAVSVAAVGETLSLELTIDGQTFTVPRIADADTIYSLYLRNYDVTPFNLGAVADQLSSLEIEAHSFKARIRKTTAAGAGNLKAWIAYEAME